VGDFRQAGDHIRGRLQEERDHIMNNFKGAFTKVKDKVVLIKFIGNLYRADATFGTALAKAAGVELESVMTMIAKK
jgi:catalase